MPMIDVCAPSDLLPPGRDCQLGEKLTLAVLKAEGVKPPDRSGRRRVGSRRDGVRQGGVRRVGGGGQADPLSGI